jgi:outer membrane protein OmpA-like peptidoglycan-associated protein
MQKDLPSAEMEKLMLANIEVTDSDLRQLAAKRAQSVKEILLKSGDIAADRIFIVEPKTLVPEKKEKIKNSRVDFKLK